MVFYDQNLSFLYPFLSPSLLLQRKNTITDTSTCSQVSDSLEVEGYVYTAKARFSYTRIILDCSFSHIVVPVKEDYFLRSNV